MNPDERRRRFFRELDVEYGAPPAPGPRWWAGVLWAASAIGCGFAWYGLYLLAVWALRTVGVILTGVPK